jgi:argininosuccinate lyase
MAGYNKDYQEDKQPLFDSFDTLEVALPLVAAVLGTMRPQPLRMQAALDDSLLATDLADHLVETGMPFRDAHECVGRAVATAERHGVPLRGLSESDLARCIPGMSRDQFLQVLDFRRSVERRCVPGGTASSSVREQIGKAREVLDLP